MWPRGPGILLPGNYCCYSYHLQRGKECLVFKGTHGTARGPRFRERCSWNVGLAVSLPMQGRWGAPGTAGKTIPFAWGTVRVPPPSGGESFGLRGSTPQPQHSAAVQP